MKILDMGAQILEPGAQILDIGSPSPGFGSKRHIGDYFADANNVI